MGFSHEIGHWNSFWKQEEEEEEEEEEDDEDADGIQRLKVAYHLVTSQLTKGSR